MCACINSNGEKAFLNIINKMLGELDENLKCKEETLQNIALVYHELSEEKQERCIKIICEVISDDYSVLICLMSILLRELQDKKIISYIGKILNSKEYPLWERLNDIKQVRMYLFMNQVFHTEYEEYQALNSVYENILQEIKAEMKTSYSYISYGNRRKKIVIVMSEILSICHAPTARLKAIYNYYRNMGYDVECFVCHMWNVEGYWDWNKRFYSNNFMEDTAAFRYDLDGTEIKGYNFVLYSSCYIEELMQAVKMIWERRPEYVLEIGDGTILAGLCSQFTTVVTMGCTKKIPVTNAPIIATPAEQSVEEKELWRQVLKENQVAIEVRHVVHGLKGQEEEIKYTKEDFGISSSAFVIILAGNRLDIEVKKSFLKIMYQTLECDVHFVIAVIGECPQLKEQILEKDLSDRIFFLGSQQRFRETIAIGDVFLNPPRQGGGTGALFAIMEEVPVITLDNCDVEANVGSKFVCNSVDEMPSLVYKYYTDLEFMKKQKENCRRRTIERTDIDSEENFRRLSTLVKEYTICQENSNNDTF